MSENVNLFDVSACETQWVDDVIAAADAAKTAETNVQPVLALLYNNAGAHNSIYRGKALGDTVTDAQWAAIKAGTFDDLYIGDYWTINSINWRIAAFDYYRYCGDTKCTGHHVVIVPDTYLGRVQMNTTSVTTGGYIGSELYKSGLDSAKTAINAAFSGHVLSHRVYLTNAVANGRAWGGAWCDSEVDLMCEQMVYGSGILSPVSNGTDIPANYIVEKAQLPLFAHNPAHISASCDWWLRDVVSSTQFAMVYNDGRAIRLNAGYAGYVRPSFCIY